MPDEVIRFLTYGFLLLLLSNVSFVYSQFDGTPFSYNNDDIKEPNFADPQLAADSKDLQKIYNDTAQMLYSSTGDGTAADIHQVYPSQNEQNYSDWFSNLLNNKNSIKFPTMYNFSKLFPRENTTKDAYYRLPDTFKVLPSNKNTTILSLNIPPNASKADSNIFQNAFNDSSYSDNDKEVYVNIPPISSMSLNKSDNSNLLNQFFHTNKASSPSTPKPNGYPTSTPSTQTTSTLMMPPTATLPKPTPYPMNSTSTIPSSPTNQSTPTVTDLLAKRIAQDETKNSSSSIDSMLYKLGLQRITLNGNSKEPMYVYRMNTTDATPDKPQNFTVPKETFYFANNETNRPPLIYGPPAHLPPLQHNQTSTPSQYSPPPGNISSSNGSSPPVNSTAMPIPNIGGSGQQGNLTYYGEPEPQDSDPGTPIPPTPPKIISFPTAANDTVSEQYGEIVYTSVVRLRK